MINVKLRFDTPHQYVFYHHQIKHLLVMWEKEQKKELYLIKEETNDELLLKYPGETYQELILQELEAIFFQTLETAEERFPAILGATFFYEKRVMGMFYHQYRLEEEPPYFFEIKNQQIVEIADEEYEDVVKTFLKEYPEYATLSEERENR